MVKGLNYVHLSTLDDYPDYLFNYNFLHKTYVIGTYLKVIDRVVVMNTHNLQSFQSFKK